MLIFIEFIFFFSQFSHEKSSSFFTNIRIFFPSHCYIKLRSSSLSLFISRYFNNQNERLSRVYFKIFINLPPLLILLVTRNIKLLSTKRNKLFFFYFTCISNHRIIKEYQICRSNFQPKINKQNVKMFCYYVM
jgi:hypothetical protein